MKRIIFLFTAASLLIVSCSKDEAYVAHYDPSELNEIHENAMDVVHKFTEDNIKKYRSGSITKSAFYDELLDSMATYLSVNTPVSIDRCKEILTNVRDSCANFNLAEALVEKPFHMLLGWEEDNSDEYHALKETHHDLRLEEFDDSYDAQHSSLITQGMNLLPTDEANELVGLIEPVLVAHDLFDSGKWDDIKSLYPNQKFFSCAVFALVGMGISYTTASVAVATATVGATSALGYGVSSGLSKSEFDLPPIGIGEGFIPIAYFIHINQVFGGCAALLDLVENHLDTE